MKRASFIVWYLLVSVLLGQILTSCSPSTVSSGSVFWYQEGLRGARAKITVSDAEYTVYIKIGAEEQSIEITAPENISGVCVTKESGGTYAENGGVKIPISEGVFEGVEPFIGAFALSEDDIAQISASEAGGTTVTVQSSSGVYTVFTDPDGNPVRIACEGERVFEMTDIEIER